CGLDGMILHNIWKQLTLLPKLGGYNAVVPHARHNRAASRRCERMRSFAAWARPAPISLRASPMSRSSRSDILRRTVRFACCSRWAMMAAITLLMARKTLRPNALSDRRIAEGVEEKSWV